MILSARTFERGIHPPDSKDLSKDIPISSAKIPSRLIVPLLQHIGAPCAPAVQIGQEVKKGQVIGNAAGLVSANVHSPVSGAVSDIREIQCLTGNRAKAVIVENDSRERSIDLKENADLADLNPEQIRECIRDAGIVGMGGAAFPMHVKLSPPMGTLIDTVIINGVECEPYITADYRLMLEKTAEIVMGAKLIMKALGVTRGYIGIEANKPQAIENMRHAVGNDAGLMVRVLKVKYPQGAEKMLIKALVNREVPPRKLPMDVGVVVQNVSTAFAVFEAVRYGKPLIERVVTVSGEAMMQPRNLLVRIGTPVSDLIDACGGLIERNVKVLSGGPMMGFALGSLDMPVTKGTSAIIALPAAEIEAGDNFDKGGIPMFQVSLIMSFRRKPESRFIGAIAGWTPAFAGVTNFT
jgi:electron transport complex protein RnfC